MQKVGVTFSREKNFLMSVLIDESASSSTKTVNTIRSKTCRIGRIIILDTKKCLAIIRPEHDSGLIICTYVNETSKSVHLHDALSLNVGTKFKSHAYSFDMNYDLDCGRHESYKTFVCWDSINNLAVMSNNRGRLMVARYSNPRNVIPAYLYLPRGCEIVSNLLHAKP